MNPKSTLKIELTPEQKQQIEQITGKAVPGTARLAPRGRAESGFSAA